MLTLFAIPKAFKEHFGLIQDNAIKSWTLLKPKPEIILFGDELGTNKYSQKFQFKNIANIKKSEYGTPLLDDLFYKAQKHSKGVYFGYVNADIILTSSFMNVFETVKDNFKEFLIVGRRYDLNVINKIDFTNKKWELEIKKDCSKKGNLGGAGWIDYFLFTKNVFLNIPPFAIGRTFWDKWLIWHALNKNIPVIDATLGILAIHQSHSYSHAVGGSKEIWMGKEAVKNIKLAGGWSHGSTIVESQYIIENNKIFNRSITARIFIRLINRLKIIVDIPFFSTISLWVRQLLNKK